MFSELTPAKALTYSALALSAGFVVYKAYRGYLFLSNMKAYLAASKANIQAITEKINGQKLQWFTLDDGMVGGKSTSKVALTA